MLEKTCHDLAKKVSDIDGSMRKLIRTTTDKMTLDIRQLEQAHKSTKAYVEQKTCTAMEALGELGNAVHRMLDNTSSCPTDSCRNEPIPLESAGVRRNGTGIRRNGQESTGMELS